MNEQKQLFHFIISPKLQGIVKFTETNLRPKEGDFIKLTFATKIDKDKKSRVKILSIELTEGVNPNLRKDITGLLEVKYKGDYEEEDLPDFAFIGDYYVPKYLLEKHSITEDCKVNARVIYGEDKMLRPRWKVIKIQKI